MDARNSSIADDAPPAKRRDLTHTGHHVKHGKPDFLHELRGMGGELQGSLAEKRVRDGGASEGWIVIIQIVVEP